MSFASTFALALVGAVSAFILGIMAGWIKRPSWLRTRAMVAVIVALILGTALFGAIQVSTQSSEGKAGGTTSPPQSAPAAIPGPGRGDTTVAVKPFIEKQGYVLRRSSSIVTNDQDKVDLDTGCPGWGDMHPHLGPSRCGETADLILDEEGVHPADERPRFIELGHNSAADYSSCRSALAAEPSRSISQLEVGTLHRNDRICVRTDLDNIALVTVDAVSTDALHQLQLLTIDFVVWRSGQDSSPQ